MSKLICLVSLFLMASSCFGQLSNIIGKDSSQVTPLAIDEQTELDAAFFNSLKQNFVEIAAAITNRQYNDQDYGTLSSAVSAATTDTALLVITTRHSITSNMTISSPAAIHVVPNGRFNITAGDTLTINAPFSAGQYQVFEGAGAVVFSQGVVETAIPQWWAGNFTSSSVSSTVTAAIQNAINSGVKEVFLPSGVYNVREVIIRQPIRLRGQTNYQEFYRSLGNTSGIVLDSIPDATIINMKSTAVDSPAINIRAGDVDDMIKSGVYISNLLFYQEHADYNSPTNYSWAISDTLSGRFWSGCAIKECMFINSFKGIQLRHAERWDVEDVYGDFFHTGLEFYTSNDVSKLERIHIWPFAWSADADTFKQSSGSSWGIYMDNVDGLLANDIFMIGREYGWYAKELWGMTNRYYTDNVGQPLVIYNPRNVGTHFSDLQFIFGSNVAQADAVIKITGDENGSTPSVMISDAQFFRSGTTTYGATDAIYVDYDSLQLSLDKIVIKGGFARSGIYLNDVMTGSVNNILFSGSFPNQGSGADSLSTVAIINNASTAFIVNFHDIRFGDGTSRAHAFRYMYDGCFDNVTFDQGESLIEIEPVYGVHASGGTVDAAYTDSIKVVTYTDNDNTAPFFGLRFTGGINGNFIEDDWYSFGAVYKVTDTLDVSGAADTENYRIIGLPDMNNSEQCILVVNEFETTYRRLTVMSVQADTSGPPTPGPNAKTFDGAIEVYSQFINKNGRLLTYPTDNKDTWFLSSIPTESGRQDLVGDLYYNSASSAGAPIGWVCTAKGTPGTWVEFGQVVADSMNIAKLIQVGTHGAFITAADDTFWVAADTTGF